MNRVIAIPISIAIAASASASLFLPAVQVGTAPATGLDNLSGLAASRANPGVLWAHNDRAGTPTITGLTPFGSVVAVTVPAATNIDWEDIAVGPGPTPGSTYVYISDFGAVETGGSIYRVPEPSLSTVDGLPAAERFDFTFPAGSYRSETLLVDPQTGDTILITKQPRNARVYRAPINDEAGELEFLFDLNPDELGPFKDLTAGDVSPDGSLIVLRNNQHAWAFERAAGQTLADALLGDFEPLALAFEPKGESLAFAADGSGFFTISEKSPPAYTDPQAVLFYGIVPEPAAIAVAMAGVLLAGRRR